MTTKSRPSGELFHTRYDDGMAAPTHSCSKCGAKLPFKTRVMQTATKCPHCGTLYKPPTYWASLSAEGNLIIIVVLLGIAGFALYLCFLLLTWVLRS